MAIAALILHLCIYKEVDSSHDHSDKIISLPGQLPVGFNQFSGYLHVDDQKHRALFYYFVEAEIDPASKPLVLWLNGGAVHSYILLVIRGSMAMEDFFCDFLQVLVVLLWELGPSQKIDHLGQTGRC